MPSVEYYKGPRPYFNNLNFVWVEKVCALVDTNTHYLLGASVLYVSVALFLFVRLHNYVVNFWVYFTEKELNNFEDLLFIIVMFFSVVFYFGSFYFSNTKLNSNYMIITTGVIFAILIAIISGFCYSFGSQLVSFLKGASATGVTSYELLTDTITFLSFTIRICVQLIRLILVFLTYYMTSELFLELSDSLVMHWGSSVKSFTLVELLLHYVHIVFEVGHLIILGTIQFMAFLFTIFWLVQFLFTCFLDDVLES